MIDLGEKQNSINILPTLSNTQYPNIFNLYQTANGAQYFYNILQSIQFPDNLDNNLFTSLIISRETSWTVISYNAYGTIDLWWLIVLTNNIQNPLIMPVNTTLKILQPQYVSTVLNQLNQLLQ